MNSCPDTKFPSAARMNSCPDTKLPSAARMNSCPDTKFPSAARMNSCPDTKLPSDVPDLRRSAEPRPAPPTRRNPFEQDDWDTARALPARARATAYISRLVCALARYIFCLTIHSYPETIVFVENYAPTSSGRFCFWSPVLPLVCRCSFATEAQSSPRKINLRNRLVSVSSVPLWQIPSLCYLVMAPATHRGSACGTTKVV